MKKYVKNLLFSFLVIISLILLLGIALVLFKYNLNISNKIFNIVGLIISSLIFLIGGIINGKLNKKRGLINGLIMTSLYLIIILVFKIFNAPIMISSIIIRSLMIILGNVIGVNL